MLRGFVDLVFQRCHNSISPGLPQCDPLPHPKECGLLLHPLGAGLTHDCVDQWLWQSDPLLPASWSQLPCEKCDCPEAGRGCAPQRERKAKERKMYQMSHEKAMLEGDFPAPASWLQPSSWIPNNWIIKKLMVVLICSVSRVVGNPAVQNQTVLYSPSRFPCLEALLIMLNWETHKLFQPGWSGVWILTQSPISCAFR